MRRRSEFNWMELLEGVLLILLGIFSFIRPGSALTGGDSLWIYSHDNRNCGYCAVCKN